ncbi:MAG: hypothetical protein Q8L64_06745 [bacterium]|nr:hypothetical protein [bacterium]
MDPKVKRQLIKDVILILISLGVAYLVMKSPLVNTITHMTSSWYILTAFVAGIFFTSIFTTAPAIAILAKLGAVHNPFVIAAMGGMGAYIGDLIILRFLKDHLAASVVMLIDSKGKGEGRFAHLLHQRLFRWSLAFLGAIILASPFPDEIGLALMGMSNISGRRFAAISFTFNAFGILVIAFIARSAIQ